MTTTPSILQQAAEVRTVALGLRDQAALPAYQKRHRDTGGLERRASVINTLLAAADTLDQLARSGAQPHEER